MYSLKYLQTLGELSSTVIRCKNHEIIFDNILPHLCASFDIRRAALFLLVDGQPEITTSYGIEGTGLLHISSQTANTIQETVKTGRTHILADSDTGLSLHIPIITDSDATAVFSAETYPAADTHALGIVACNIIKSALMRKYELQETATLVKENKKLRVIMEGGKNTGIGSCRSTQHSDSTKVSTLNELADSYEKKIITDALNRSKGNMSAAARLLGLSPRVMHYKINRLGIKVVKK